MWSCGGNRLCNEGKIRMNNACEHKKIAPTSVSSLIFFFFLDILEVSFFVKVLAYSIPQQKKSTDGV